MIEIDIPKDIREYDSKLVGPFTTRQTIFLVVGGVIALGIYAFTKNTNLPSDAKFIIPAIFALPAILFGFLKPYGMALEKFLSTVFISNFVAPQKRLYKIKNCYIDKKPLTKKELKKKRESMPKSNICIPYK